MTALCSDNDDFSKARKLGIGSLLSPTPSRAQSCCTSILLIRYVNATSLLLHDGAHRRRILRFEPVNKVKGVCYVGHHQHGTTLEPLFFSTGILLRDLRCHAGVELDGFGSGRVEDCQTEVLAGGRAPRLDGDLKRN